MTQGSQLGQLGLANEQMNAQMGAQYRHETGQHPAIPPQTQDKPRSAFNMVGEMGPLFAALAKAQGSFGAITKDEDVDVIKEGRKLYSFVYAPLDVVLAATRKGLSENGLSLFHGLAGRRETMMLRTILAHSTGAYLECVAELQPKADREGAVTVQALGSEVTYVRRYTVLCLLGVFPADEDDDGGAAEGLQVQRNGPRANTRPTPPPVQPSRPSSQATAEPKQARSQDAAFAEVAANNGYAMRAERTPTTPPPAPATPERTVELDPAVKEARRKQAIAATGQLFVKAGFKSRAECQEFNKSLTGKDDSTKMSLEEVEILKAALEAKIAG